MKDVIIMSNTTKRLNTALDNKHLLPCESCILLPKCIHRLENIINESSVYIFHIMMDYGNINSTSLYELARTCGILDNYLNELSFVVESKDGKLIHTALIKTKVFYKKQLELFFTQFKK